MPKNPVRAAKKAGRQEVRAAKQTNKVAKIQSRTQKKLEKFKGTSATATTPTASAPKFKTAEELKSTIKMPDFKSRIVEMAKDKAKASGTGSTGYKAPVAKTTPKSLPSKTPTPKPKTPSPTPKPKVPTPTPAPAKTGPYVVSKGYDEAVVRAKENAKGTYLTQVDKRNADQKIQAKMDKKKEYRKRLESFMPNKKMGGGMKGKKC